MGGCIFLFAHEEEKPGECQAGEQAKEVSEGAAGGQAITVEAEEAHAHGGEG